MMIRSACILVSAILFLISCNSEQRNQTPSHGLKITYTQGVWMNPDSFAKPVSIPAGEPIVIPAGEPTVIPTNLNVHVAGEPTIIPAGKPRVCTPGMDTFLLPKTVPAKGKVVPAGMPEVVVAKDADAKDINPANFSFYKTLQGIKQSTIRCMIQDKSGNIWFGTNGGVSRYDGKSFTNFTNKEGLANNIVYDILEDKAGNLWFGTSGGGASFYDGKSFTNFTEEDGLANNIVWSIIEDRSGNIWFGTSGGISCYDGTSFTNYTDREGLISSDVNCVLEDRNGNIWAATINGVSRFDGKSFSSFTMSEGLVDSYIFNMMEDKSGNIWFGTAGGVSKYDGKSFTNFTDKQGLASNAVFFILEDMNGKMWFATEGGAMSYDGKLFTTFTDKEGLSDIIVFSILEDKAGNLWLGTYGGGVCRYDGRTFSNFTDKEGLANTVVYSVLEDKSGSIWFGTGGGVSCYDGKSFTTFTDQQGLAYNHVSGMLEDKNGDLWFATYGGVSRYDGKNFYTYTDAEGLVHYSTNVIYEDRSGNIWIGTVSGISIYDGKSFTNLTEEEGLVNPGVVSILEDQAGNVWIGTMSGASRYDGKSFTNFTAAEGFTDNPVYSIIEDNNGNIWFGTIGSGVFRYDGKAMVNFTDQEGLGNNTVLSSLQDAEGNIWFGTRNGLSKISAAKLSQLNNVLNSEKTSDYSPISEALFYQYSYNDGFLGLVCKRNAVYQDTKSRIWWGADILTCYNPEGDHADLSAPSIAVSSVKLFSENIAWSKLGAVNIDTAGKEIIAGVSHDTLLSNGILLSNIRFDSISPWYSLPQHLSLPYDNSNITFSYVGVHMQSRNHIKYQYKLEGLDDYWSAITERNEAPYGNVPPGEYVFKVKAMNQSGVWSEPFEYAFEVRPPWWETTWFRSGVGIFIIASVIGIFRFRTRQLRARQKELEQTVEERTKEVVAEKKTVETQKHIIEEKQKDIIDSINYAQRIQHALLASDSLLNEHLPEHFLFFQPKDIVSGDFYWASTLSNHRFALVTADSTGHGVPGAIMSMLNISCLKESVKERLSEPAEILNRTRQLVIETLAKDGSSEGGKDGMDCSLISFDFVSKKLTFAGANNPVWIVRNKELIELLPDKMPVGKHDKDNIPFTEQEFQLQNGDCIYTLTDGMPDQFGGPQGKKFKYKPLKELLVSIAHESMEEQNKIISETFENWKGDLEQVDDVTIVGVRV